MHLRRLALTTIERYSIPIYETGWISCEELITLVRVKTGIVSRTNLPRLLSTT